MIVAVLRNSLRSLAQRPGKPSVFLIILHTMIVAVLRNSLRSLARRPGKPSVFLIILPPFPPGFGRTANRPSGRLPRYYCINKTPAQSKYPGICEFFIVFPNFFDISRNIIRILKNTSLFFPNVIYFFVFGCIAIRKNEGGRQYDEDYRQHKIRWRVRRGH
jgi:hypothetical protein